MANVTCEFTVPPPPATLPDGLVSGDNAGKDDDAVSVQGPALPRRACGAGVCGADAGGVCGGAQSTGSQKKKRSAAGLGFTYKLKEGAWRVSTVKSGGWAEKSGEVQSGDVIVSVGGRKVDGNMMDLKGLTKLIQGEEDTAVKIVLVRAGGEERELEAVRSKTQ